MISGADNGTIHHGAVGQGECVRLCCWWLLYFLLLLCTTTTVCKCLKKLEPSFIFSILSLQAGNMSSGEMQPKQNGLNLFISCGCGEITKVPQSKDATGL